MTRQDYGQQIVTMCCEHVRDVVAASDDGRPGGPGIRQRDLIHDGGLILESPFQGAFVRALLDAAVNRQLIERIGTPRAYRYRLPQ
ncbi:MAG: hypothetical protein OXG65_02340 [Chloroflexi bacterium]|nr:hypothetical protein [Chloroflexota bacterium]